MLAVKQRRSSEYVSRQVGAGPRLADLDPASGDAASGVTSPARLMQAQLAERLEGRGDPVSLNRTAAAQMGTGLSLRGRAAAICAMALVSWLPIAAAGWLILA